MAIIKCKMCGGDMEIAADKTFGICEYCGTAMTLPKVDDEQRAAAFNRGNHFRRIGEFDKALAVYERIVQEDNTDAEAHWCSALCRFGIEYVEDPATYEWLPTCHRASFDSFLEDVDFKAALEHSDGITRRQYQKDAAKIAEVQRGILATSQNAEPYDVFICYKESDPNGDRTRDSLLAQDIYYQLTEQGRRVFFARLTLEDVAGTQYEPYIFAALNSAKVMVVVGTKAEYLNSVWVKNEWSRFLSMMKKDHSKLLLPCFRDMDPYDLPEQLSVLQSYDMSKIGFIQDLTRGIAKVLDADKKPVQKETVIVQQSGDSANIAPLLKRAFMFLEDGNWTEADSYCERVLDQDPENAQAYLGKLMAELRVRQQSNLANCDQPFDDRSNYKKALRFADDKLAAELKRYITHINERNEVARLIGIYTDAFQMMASAHTEEAFLKAAARFEDISNYKDSAQKAAECREKAIRCKEQAEAARKDDIYDLGCRCMNKDTIDDLKEAICFFQKLLNWRDSAEKINYCEQRIEDLKAQKYNELYDHACGYMADNTIQSYMQAIHNFRIFDELTGGWRDHKEKIAECQRHIDELDAQQKNKIYNTACSFMNEGTLIGYEKARGEFNKLPAGFRDCKEKLDECLEKVVVLRRIEEQKVQKAKKKARTRKMFIWLFVLMGIAAACVLYSMYGKTLEARQADDAIAAIEQESRYTDEYLDAAQKAADLVNALSEKELVSLDNLQTLENILNEEAARIDAEIDKIPALEDIKLASESIIDEANTFYNNAPDAIRERVRNAEILPAAIAQMEQVKEDAWVDCTKCGGDGRVTCDLCNGKGSRHVYHTTPNGKTWQVSQECSTTMSCPTCGGKGGEYIER